MHNVRKNKKVRYCLFQHCNLFLQRLMEEIERNKDNIENCQKNAKAYIDSVKVRDDMFD